MTDKDSKSASCAKCDSENLRHAAGGTVTCGDCGARLTSTAEPPYTALVEEPASHTTESRGGVRL